MDDNERKARLAKRLAAYKERYPNYDYEKEMAYKAKLSARLSRSPEKMENMLMDSVQKTADGCKVEPDGTCSHGYRSPSLLLGII